MTASPSEKSGGIGNPEIESDEDVLHLSSNRSHGCQQEEEEP